MFCKDIVKYVFNKNRNQKLMPKNQEELFIEKDSELLFTAENNMVFRPVFSFRKIQQIKKRYNMYNTFSG